MECFDQVYDVVVIGAGMIGSSCAKYVSECEEVNKCILIGPNSRDRENGLFGAWQDEGRITRILDRNPYWGLLATKSIERYRKIESSSGIPFFNEVGYLSISSRLEGDSYRNVLRNIRLNGYKGFPVGKDQFPDLNWPQECKAYHQPDMSGYINPRGLVAAQQAIAKQNGCTVVNGNATSLIKNEEGLFKITVMTSNKATFNLWGKKVVLAQGAYVNMVPLLNDYLNNGMEPDLKLTKQTVAYLEVSDDEAHRLKDMPTVVTSYRTELLDGTYILPPIKYPDGKFYLKLGHHDLFEEEVQSHQELFDWYATGTGNPTAVKVLAAFVTDHFVPSIKVKSVQGGCCVTAKTPGKAAPFVQEVSPGVTLIAGGNGYAAKSCDEIGRIGAMLSVTGQWTSAIPQTDMQVQWKPIHLSRPSSNS